jgi:hypothetical protein
MMNFIKQLGRHLTSSPSAWRRRTATQLGKRTAFSPRLEKLEDRLVPTQFAVDGTNDPDRFTISYVTDADGSKHFSIKRETGGFSNTLNAPVGQGVNIEARGGDDTISRTATTGGKSPAQRARRSMATSNCRASTPWWVGMPRLSKGTRFSATGSRCPPA